MLFNEQYRDCIYSLSKSVSPSDVFSAWRSIKNNTKDMCAILTLSNYEKSAYPVELHDLTNSNDSGIVPYFQSDKLYFIEDELLEEMFSNQPYSVNFRIDYSVMFDTNFSSYIHKFVSGLPITNNNFYSMIDLLIRKGFHYDYIFYLIENYYNHFYKIGNQNSMLKNKVDVFSNIVSLELFKSIDREEYCNTGKLKYNISREEAILSADYLFNDFYNSENGKESQDLFITIHKCTVLFLIGVLKIRFQSSKSPQNKLAELFNYTDNVVGVYLDRETIVAHKFFENPKNVSILNKINKCMNKERVYELIENIAWDFTVPRIMEYFMEIGGEGRFFIPFFLTHDKNLRELLRLYNVKGVLFNKNGKGLVPFTEETNIEYYQRIGSKVDFDMLFSTDRIEKREQKYKDNKRLNFNIIDDEFNELANVLECL